MKKSRGRPRGRPDPRSRIAEAARDLFLARGYRRTTIRAVAAHAGVDSALISYHFGSKQGLFSDALQLRCGAPAALTDALAGDRAGLADRLLDALTTSWELGPNPPAGGLQDEDAMRVLREFLETELVTRLAEYLGGPDATERATAAVVVLGGLIFTRYLNPLAPVAGHDTAAIRRLLAPALTAALRTRPTRP